VVAIMVEFQPDDSRFTSGDGTFDGDLFGGLQPRVDPLPHDAGYFEARLDFLKNYVEKVSGGKTTITSQLVPRVVRMPERMGHYSPTGPDAGSDAELVKLARMVEGAWEDVDRSGELALDGYDADELVFVIFHAGVGRDLELMGTTLDKTPEDLPSLFFGTSALNRLLGDLPRVGGRSVDHTLLLPRTETRRGRNSITGEDFLAEFSINGMLAATFFSRLGVPDLFNTETGASGIGPFGLMDPLGIFAFNGLFPPEPSAWTKYFLGWSDTRTVPVAEPTEVQLYTASEPENHQIKVPINESEYFLVENRYRGREQVTLTVWRDGERFEFTAGNETDGFSRFDIGAFPGGVVVDVSNYDWALPGGVDEDGNVLSGGVLIWHIDERIIGHGLAGNRVNVDPRRRGVSLREADGSQDIGYPAPSDFGPQTHLGTPFDYYFEGNPVRVVTRTGREIALYQNRFGPDTVPSSRTSDGGNSFVQIRDFSSSAETMHFVVERVTGTFVEREPALSAIRAERGSAILSTRWNDDLLVFVRENIGEAGHLYAVNQADGSTSVLHTDVVSKPAFTSAGELVVVRQLEAGMQLVAGTREVLSDATPSTSAPIALGSVVFVIDMDGRLLRFETEVGREECVVCEAATNAAMTSDGGAISFVSGETLYEVSAGGDILGQVSMPPGFRASSMVRTMTGDRALLDTAMQRLVIQGEAVMRGQVDISAFLSTSASPAYLVPLSSPQSVRSLVLLAAGQDLVAFERSGAVAEGFPIRLDASVSAQPIVLSDLDGDFVLVPLQNGRLEGYRITEGGVAQMADFPLAVGASIAASPALSGDLLLVASTSGELHRFRLQRETTSVYGEAEGNAQNSRSVASQITIPEPPDRLAIDASETYNWPNPIRNGFTFLRVTTTRRAAVDIHIVDGAGQSVDRLSIQTVTANVPTEVRWETDAASGLYFARFRATFEDGSEDVRVVKMAIMR
jgi:hypothetical protein